MRNEDHISYLSSFLEGVQSNYTNEKNYKMKPLDYNIIKKFNKIYPTLNRIRMTEECKGIALMDGTNLVGIINVDTNRDYIVSLEVFGPYKRKGISHILLDIATKKLNAKYLSVRKTNTIAIKLYRNNNWKIYDEDNYMYYMKK